MDKIILDQWQKLKSRLSPLKLVQKEEEPIRSASPMEKARIVSWAGDTTCREDFIPYLTDLIDRANLRARTNFSNHAETSFWLGYVSSLEALREHFLAWRDNRTPTPQKGQLP